MSIGYAALFKATDFSVVLLHYVLNDQRSWLITYMLAPFFLGSINLLFPPSIAVAPTKRIAKTSLASPGGCCILFNTYLDFSYTCLFSSS